MLTIQHVDPRVTRTRRLLIDAFMSLMAESQYDSITITQITTRATVNRATFYSHFADKRELAEAMVRENFSTYLDEHVDLKVSDIRVLIGSLFRAAAYHRGTVHGNCKATRHNSDELRLFESMCESEIRLQLRERVHAWFNQQAPNDHESREKHQCTLMASLISAAIYAGVVEWSILPSKGEMEMELIVDRLARLASD